MDRSYKKSTETVVLEKSKMAFIISSFLYICMISMIILVPVATFARETLGFVSIILASTIFIVVLILPYNYRNMGYILSESDIYVSMGRVQYSIPISDLTIIDEEMVRTRNPKYAKIIIKSDNIRVNRKFSIVDIGLLGLLIRISDKKMKKIALSGIKNPVQVCDLINEYKNKNRSKMTNGSDEIGEQGKE